MKLLLKYPIALLILITAVLFIPFLGASHLFDWDEINFAECAREMINTGDYITVQINYFPFWEKPPLFIWMQALSMNIFGVNEFSARFPNAVCGIITVLCFYFIGKKERDQNFGFLWSLVYVGSILPHLYFKSGIIDPWFNLFIFLSIYFLYKYLQESKPALLNVCVSAAFIGLAVLTKGPVAVLVLGLCFAVYLIWNKFKIKASFRDILTYIFVAALVGGSWFLLQWMNGKSNLIAEFIKYQIDLFKSEDTGHAGPFYYHIPILLIGCFPASFFFIQSFIAKAESDKLNLWMKILFFVVLVLFSIVRTKIVHYSSLCYIPMTFITADFLHRKSRHLNLKWGLKAASFILLSVFAVVFIAATTIDKWKHIILNAELIKDQFAAANLAATSGWTGWEPLVGLAFSILAIYILFIKNYFRFALTLFVGIGLIINSCIAFIAPNVEAYSQRAALDFYIEKAKEKGAIVETADFKSYAQLFYSNRPYTSVWSLEFKAFLKEKKVSEFATSAPALHDYFAEFLRRPGSYKGSVYFVIKNDRLETIRKEHSSWKELYQKNGFVFLKQE